MRSSHSRFNRFMSVVGLFGLMILSTCSVNQVGLGAKVDITPPKVAITGPAEDGQYLRGDVELSGTASDDLGIASLTITYPSAAGPDVVTQLAVSGGLWSITIPTGTAEGLPEGQVTITASVTDSSGKTTSDTLLAYIDNKAPTVLVTSPISYAALAKDAPKYTDSIDIKGEVYDPSPVPTGSVKVRLLNMSDRTPVPTTGDAQGWQVAEGTNTFAVRFLLKNSLFTDVDDKKGFFYEVQATDQAGNVSSYYYHRNDIYDVLPPNTIFPSMNELGRIDQARTGESEVSHIPYSELVTIQLGTITPTTHMGNFQYSAISKPKIKFSNFDQDKPQAENALAPNSVITGSISPDANGGAIEPSSVTVDFLSGNVSGATIVTLKDTDNSSLSDNIELLGFGDSIVFTVNLKNGATQLPPGLYGIRITATAPGSQPQSAEGDFIIDDNAPILTETKINTGALTPKNAAFTLGGRAKAGTALKTIEVFQAKDPTPVSETPTQLVQTIQLNGSVDTDWETAVLPIPLGDGTYYYLVKLSSVSGKASTIFRTILYDATAPTLAVSTPAAASWTANQSITIKGTADDGNGTGVNAVRVWVGAKTDTPPADVSTWPLATGTASWLYTVADLGSQGDKKLWVTSQDKAGNWNTAASTVLFGYDSALPDTTVTAASYQKIKPFNIAGTATDNLGVSSVTVTGNGAGTVTLDPGTTSRTWTVPVNPTVEGANTYTITVTDVSGQTKVKTATVTYDTVAPVITVSNLFEPPQSTPLVDTTFKIRGTANDENGLQSVAYQVDGGAWTAMTVSPAWNIPVITLFSSEGVHTIRFKAADKAGNEVIFPDSGDDPFLFGLDLAPPALVSNASTLNNTNQKASFTLSGTAQDFNGITQLEYSLDGGTTWTTIAGTSTGNTVVNWSQTVTVPTDGSFDGLKALRIRATDTYDKITMHSASVRVDASAPSLSLNNITDSQLLTSLSFAALGNVTDNGGSGVNRVEYSLDGSTWTSAVITGSSWSATLPLAQKLGQRLLFRAWDSVGNVTTPVAGTTDVSVNVDTAAPTISNLNIPSGFANASFLLNFDVADTLDLATVTVTQSINGGAALTIPVTNLLSGQSDTSLLNFGTAQWGAEPFPRDPADLAHKLLTPEGEFEYVITVTDTAGRPPVSVTRKLTVDTVAPSVSIINPTSGATVNGMVTINAAASDANGIQSVKYLYRLASDASALPAFTSWTSMGSAPYATNLNTSAFADDNWVLYVGAQDKAGNVTKDVFIPFTTSQAGDIPTITLTNMNAAASTLAQANANLFLSGSVTVTATAADDDDIDKDSVMVWVGLDGDAAPVTDGQFTQVNARPAANGKNVSFSHNFSGLSEGAMKLYVRVKDWSLSKAGLPVTSKTIGPVYFAYDSADPALTVSNKATYDGKAVNANFTLSGTTSDANLVTKLEFSLDGGATWPVTVASPAASWNQIITVPSAGAADGVKNVRVRATDGFGKTTVQSLVVTFDTVVPNTPAIAAFGAAYFDSQLNASGTTSDATSGVSKVQYSFDNSTWTDLTGQDNWFGSLNTGSLLEGTNTLSIRAIDRAGNTSATASSSFTVDRSNPVITESSYSGVVYKKAAFSVTADVADALALSSNALSVTLEVNGTPVTAPTLTQNTINSKHHTYDFTVPVTHGEGVYQLTLHAVDAVGRSALTVTRTITVDTLAPNFAITNLTNNDLLQAASFTVQGTANDGAGSGVKRLQYKLNGAASWTDATGNTNWAAALNSLTDGLSQSIEFQAEDNSGNTSASTITRTFRVDLAAPALAETVSTLGTSLAYSNATVNLGGAVTDGNGVSHLTVSYQKDGGASVSALDDTDNNGTWAWALAAPGDHSADGLYDITLTATDGAGKTSTLTRRIQIDTASPDLTIVSPVSAELVAGSSYKIQGQVTDNGGKGVTSLEYSKNSTNGTNGTWTPVTLTGLNWSVNAVDFSSGAEGARTLWVRASDGLNTVTAVSVPFNYDTQPPVLTETTVASTTQVVTNAAVVYNGTASDTNALSQLTVSINGGAASVVPVAGDHSWTMTFPNTTQGTFVLVFQAMDTAGRTTSLTRNVLIDTTGPATAIDNPGLYLSGNAGSLFGTADDGSGSGMDKVQYSLTSATGPWTDATGKNNWLVSLNLDTDGPGADTGLAEGAYTLYVRGLDKAGNATLTAATQAFQIDQAAPALSLYKVDGNDFVADTIYGNNTLALTGTATDSYGVQSVGITQSKSGGTTDNLTVTLNPGTTSRVWGASADLGQGEGTYVITVTITDVVGRETYIQKTVVKDTQAPALAAVTSPASSGQWLSGATFNFSGTAADVGSAGVALVYYGFGNPGLTPPASLSDPFWATASGTTSWTASVSLSGEGLRTLYLKTLDKAGNLSALQTFDYGIDQSSPNLSYALPSGSFINGNLTLSGTASDSNAVTTVSVSEKKPGDASFNFLGNATYNSGNGNWSYFHPLSAFDAFADGVYQYRITVTDAAGKSTSFDKTLTQDFLNPGVSLNAPLPTLGTGPTYQGNGTLTLGGTISDLNGLDALEIKVGTGAWNTLGSAPFTSFSTTVDTTVLPEDADITISVRATDKAGNLGMSSYTIHVDQDTDKPVVVITGPSANENVQSANISMTGTISDDDGVNANGAQYRISYNGGTSWTAWTAIPSGNLSGTLTNRAFTYSINDPSNGSKILQIRATDTGTIVGDATSVTFSQDTGAPVLSAMTPAEGTVTNANSFTVAGTATDSAAVLSVTYRVLKDGVEIVPAAATNLGADTDGGAGEIRTFTSPSISTASGTGNYQVQLISSDGTNTRQENINIIVDKTNPSAAFSIPSAASLQNNVIVLQGTASDNRLLSTVAVEIWKGGAKVANAPGTVTGTSNWSLSFDTSAFDDSTNATFVSGNAWDITLRAVATDSVGNTGTTDLTFRIDQDTDKPAIGVSTAQSPTYLSAFTVNGTASDDDGIASIEVSPNGSSWTPVTAPGGGWTKNSSWNTTLSAGDGAKALYVRVTDTSTPAIVTTSTAFAFMIDQESPDSAFTSPSVNSKLKTGEFAFAGSFADESGVASVKLKVDSGDFSSGDIKTAAFTPGLSGTWTYTFSSADLDDGVRTIYLQVTDAAGKTSSVTRAVTVDETAPVVTISEPASGSSAFGLVRLRGSAVDATSGIKNVKVGLGKTINTADWDNPSNTWYPATGAVSWEYVITNINSFANTTYARDLGDTNGNGVVDGGETWQNIWKMFLYIRSEDTAGTGSGNISVIDTYYLEVDPLKDRPEITVLQPVDTVSTVGGFLRIVGSSYDTNFIAKNQIAFDVNNDGVFNGAGDVWPGTALPVDQTDANTTAWYAMTGTTSWSVVLNNSGEFNPVLPAITKTIKFKVRSVDSKVSNGGAASLAGLESTYTVTFSNQVPQYSAVNLATGDTIGGTVILTGYVKVPSAVGMASIMFNHEGPRLSNAELIGGPAGMRAVLLTGGDPAYEAGFDKYAITATINTTDADLFANNAGSMTVSLRSYDNSSFQSFQTISLTVDNKAPSAPSFTGLTEIAGTSAVIQGQVSDTGVVSGIRKVVFYLQQGTNVYRLKGGSGNLTNGSNQVLDLTNAAYNDYRIVIDKTTEGGNDAGAGGDGDGFNESLTSSFGVYTWAAGFNSTLVSDGKYDVHMAAYDVGNNVTTLSQTTFVANNKPAIASIVLSTDLNGNGNVTDSGESSSPISTGYATTGFTGRNNKLGFTINALGGNGTKRYSVLYSGVEQNSTLTSNVLVVDTSGIAESTGTNDRLFTIKVYDSTTSDNTDQTDELFSTITVGVTIDNLDTVAPSITVAPFGTKYPDSDDETAKASTTAVGAYNDNIKLISTVRQGHVEYAADSQYNGTDADVSGEVIFKGKVSDNQKVNRITATIPGFDGGNGAGVAFNVYTYAGGGLSGTGWSFTVDGTNYLTEAKGNVFNWNFTWNSALLSTVVGNNISLSFTSYDANGTPNVSPATTLTVDVIPYITSLSRGAAYNTLRSKQGRYVLRRGEAVTVNGFNLFQSTSDTLTFGVASVNLPSGAPTTGFTVNVPAAATSGNLNLTVNSIPAGNNGNLNTKAWNLEATVSSALDGSTLWTDDRKVHIWQSDSNQATSDFGYFTTSINPVYPAMSYNAGVLYGSWSNYATSNVYYAPNNGAATTIYHSYDPLEHTDISYGARPTVVYNANTYGNGAWTVAGAGGIQIYDVNAPNNSDGSGTYPEYDMEELFHNQLLMQFINPRIVNYNSDIHISYHDTKDKSVKYAYVANSDASTAEHLNWINLDGGSDTDDTTPPVTTTLSQTATISNSTYISTAAPTVRLSNRTGTVATLLTALLNTNITGTGTTIATTTVPANISNGTAGVLTSFLVTVGAAVTSGTTPVANIQPNTTISTLPVAVGSAVTASTVIATMANGTSITAGSAGWLASLPVAVGGTVTHGITVVATVTNKRVASVNKAVNDTVAVGDLLLTLSDSTQVTATAAGTVASIAAVNSLVGTTTTMATITASRVVSSANRSAAAGEYSAIDVTPVTHYPVVAYYDMTNLTVKIAHANTATPTVGSDFKVQYVMAGGDTNYKFSGKYISLKIDSAGYAHLVFYRNSTGDLIYMKSTNNPTNGTTDYTFGASVILDSIGAVGIWADLSLDGTTPYISYLDSSYTNTFDGVKLAYYDTTLNDWEYMNAPLDFEVENVRTSVEVDTAAGKFWKAAVGFASSDYYRIGYYVK